MVGKKGGVMGEENLKPIPMASINHTAARHHFFSSFTLFYFIIIFLFFSRFFCW
jgi:hypothetical protein